MPIEQAYERGWYEVIVTNVGKVAEGREAFKMNSVYHTYTRMSDKNVGRIGGESVTFYRNGQVVKDHTGFLYKDVADDNTH